MPSSDRIWSLPIKPLRRVKEVSAAATRRARKHSRVWLYTQRVGADFFILSLSFRGAWATTAGGSTCGFEVEACSRSSLIMACTLLPSSCSALQKRTNQTLHPDDAGRQVRENNYDNICR